MTEAALSEVSDGAKWNPDPSFSVADALLADPEFASVLKVVCIWSGLPRLARHSNLPTCD
jgi:hypothetical protein